MNNITLHHIDSLLQKGDKQGASEALDKFIRILSPDSLEILAKEIAVIRKQLRVEYE